MTIKNWSGSLGEKLAAQFYEKRGYKIIAKNFSNKKGRKIGEIDFIAIKQKEIRYVEVKSRVSLQSDLALSEIDHAKQIKILLMARYFLMLNPQYAEFNQHLDAAIVLFNPFDKISAWVKIYSDVIEDMLKR